MAHFFWNISSIQGIFLSTQGLMLFWDFGIQLLAILASTSKSSSAPTFLMQNQRVQRKSPKRSNLPNVALLQNNGKNSRQTLGLACEKAQTTSCHAADLANVPEIPLDMSIKYRPATAWAKGTTSNMILFFSKIALLKWSRSVEIVRFKFPPPQQTKDGNETK